MELVNKDDGAEAYVPNGQSLDEALKRTTHLCIGAHQDDQEIFAIDGIGQCFGQADKGFTGICVTDGRGPGRKGRFEKFSDDDMANIRHQEQNEAARQGKYAAEIQLRYKSGDLKGANDINKPKQRALVQELFEIMMKAEKLDTLYVHNPLDKHETHNVVTRATLEALRMLPPEKLPKRILGVEVWRGLDTIPDSLKTSLDVSKHLALRKQLVDCHVSQIEGGRNYADGANARAVANACFSSTHTAQDVMAVDYAVDLMPLVKDKSFTMEAYVKKHVVELEKELMSRAKTYEPNSPTGFVQKTANKKPEIEFEDGCTPTASYIRQG